MSAATIIQLIAQVGWPATQYLIERYSNPAPWSAADSARLQSIIDTPAEAFEKSVQPLPVAP
jgi:hypothetical protein